VTLIQKSVFFIQKPRSLPIARYTRFIFAGQASHPSLELPIKSGRAVEAATTIDFCQRVVSFAKQLEALFYSIAREQIMKSCVSETTQEGV
jgi:hypothetical protein